jgi:glutathione S-transferase
MIILHGFGPAFGLPDPSPFVLKSEVQLKMAGVPYRLHRGFPQDAPKGKIPYIQVGAHRLGDTTFIRAHIEREHGFDFDRGLSAEQRAQAWAIERMLEDHLYFAIVNERWMDDENFAKGPSHFFDSLSPEIRDTAREQVRANLRGHGIGRHRVEEIEALGGRSLAALSMLLGDKTYLFGETQCGTDATAFAMVASVLTPFFSGGLRRRAEAHANLVDYAGMMMERFYPDYLEKAA